MSNNISLDVSEEMAKSGFIDRIRQHNDDYNARVTQRMSHSHLEALANAIIGAALAQVVLWLFSIPVVEAISLNAAILGVSYVRAFAIRRWFERMG